MKNGACRSMVGHAALVFGLLVLVPQVAFGQGEETVAISEELFTVNNTWMLVATFLVFIMHLGFACLESGLTQAKNTVNILFKNTSIVAIGLLTYAVVGFNLMYPGEFSLGGFFGFDGLGLDPGPDGNTIAYADGAYTYWTDFIFQAMFAATAATIVSGAVAERIKLHSFLIFTALYVALVYPIAGSWKWGGGWLDAMGFYDFAGSTLVHSVGGWGAPRRHDRPRTQTWKIHERADPRHRRTQHASRDNWRLPAVARMVWIQWRVGAQRRPWARLAGLCDHLTGGRRWCHRRHADLVDVPAQA